MQCRGPQGPRSLQHLSQEGVLDGIYWASKGLDAAFSVGGTLGRLPVALAVSAAPALSQGQAQRPGGPAGKSAQVVLLPGGGEADLQTLLALCTPAAFGRGQATVVDESYRAALALPAARLFTHQLETSYLSRVLDEVRRQLLPGVGRLSGRLHALNAYRQGGFFRPHRDTPRGDPSFVASLVVCLPVAHAGGALRVEHGRRSVTYEWGTGAADGEVQWAAFFSDCVHEVLPVTSGTRVSLAYEVFAHHDTGSPPERALTDAASELARMLRAALDTSSFFTNGGRIGLACQHAYPQSLLNRVTQQEMRGMLKGVDAALLRTLGTLQLPIKIVRVWNDPDDHHEDMCLQRNYDDVYASAEDFCAELNSLWVSDLSKPLNYGCGIQRKEENEGTDISWVGDFSGWMLGALGDFYGNEGLEPKEFYCNVGLVVEVPRYENRPSVGRLAWAGSVLGGRGQKRGRE